MINLSRRRLYRTVRRSPLWDPAVTLVLYALSAAFWGMTISIVIMQFQVTR